jgi:hypothetical protein
MAGDRQHILPRFLLKGFASRNEKGKIFTWVYPRNQTPIEANIRKVGVEKHFYGKQGEMSVDDDITEFEGKYAPLLDELRANEIKSEISDQRIPHLITHLVTRTKHLRDSIRNSSEYMADKFLAYLSNFDNFKAAILSKPEFIIDAIEEKFRDFRVSQAEKDTMRNLIPILFPAIIDKQIAEMLIVVRHLRKNIKKIAAKGIKEGHIKGLSQELIPNQRLNTYGLLHWFIINVETSLILGDLSCLFEFASGKRFRAIDFQDDDIINIFLPISDNKLLIGTSFSTIPQININLINENIAKCSREFFISSKYSKDILFWVPLIDSESEMLSKQELEQKAKEIVHNYIAKKN